MKKKIIMLTLMIAMCLIFAVPVMAATSDITVFVNGTQVKFPDQKPYIDSNSRTLVPVRFPAETLGATVDWNANKKLVTVTQKAHDQLPDAEIALTIGKKDVIVNGKTKTMDTTAIITNSRTMVPIRFISEYLGAVVKWQDSNKGVYVFTQGQTESAMASIMAEDAVTIPPVAGQPDYWSKVTTKITPEIRAYLQSIPYTDKYTESFGEPWGTKDTAEIVQEKIINVVLAGVLQLQTNQKFYTQPQLVYLNSAGGYCLRGVLQTKNADGTYTEQDMEYVCTYGLSSDQPTEGAHWTAAYLTHELSAPRVVKN